MEGLGTRIRETRLQRKMSQKELAASIPTSQSTINDLEKGKNKSTKYLLTIADILNVDAHWLERGTGSAGHDEITIVHQGAPLPIYTWSALTTYMNDPEQKPAMMDMFHRCPVDHSKHSFCVHVTAMQATARIQEDEVVYIDPSCTYIDGCFALCLYGSVLMLRQLISDGMTTYIKTTNENVPPERRMLPVALTADETGRINLPDNSDNAELDKVKLCGLVIFRGEIYR